MASTGSRMLEWMTHGDQYEIQQRLMRDLNAHDILNLRLTCRNVSRNIPASGNVNNLAQCNDTRYAGMNQPPIPCPNARQSIPMRWCDNPVPSFTAHEQGIAGSVNVCSACLNHNRTGWGIRFDNTVLDMYRAGLCKPCSKSLKRRYPQGLQHTCTCRQNVVNRGWHCHTCIEDSVEGAEAVGHTKHNELIHTHKRRVATGRGGRGRKVIRIDVRHDKPPRRHMACMVPGCGNPSWIRHHTHQDDSHPDFHFIKRRHPEAGWGCLICMNTNIF